MDTRSSTPADVLQGASSARPATSVADVVRTRRTIHLFEPERVPPAELIRRAVDLARWAPNHRLTEPWRFYVLGPETADAVARRNAELVTAKRGPAAGAAKLERWQAVPGWLVVTCRRSDDPVRSDEDYAACACAIQNLQLFLWSEGVGTKWTTGAVTRDARFYELVEIDPEAERVVGMVWYGYAATLPPAPPRRPVEEVLSERP